MRTAFVVVVCFLFVSASAYVWNSNRTDRIFYDGWIDETLPDRIRNFPAEDLKTIVINSGGGEVDYAIEAAELMQANKIRLIVDGYCLSACASILLATGQDNSIREGSIVGFHRPPGAIFFLNEYLERERNVSLRHMNAYRTSERTLDIYRKAGIRTDIFAALLLRQRLHCLDIDQESDGDTIERINMNLRVDVYIPNSHFFKQFGWSFRDSNFPREGDFDLIESRLFSDTDAVSVLIEDVDFRFPDESLHGNLKMTRIDDCN